MSFNIDFHRILYRGKFLAQNEMRLVDSTVPAEPSELAAINVTEHSITVSWVIEGAAERVYIEISDTNGGQTQSQWVGIKTRNKTIEGLTPGQGNFRSLQYS